MNLHLKNIKIILIALLIICGACSSTKFLPKPENYGTFEYGCYIKVKTKDYNTFKGELLAAFSDSVYIMHNFEEMVVLHKGNLDRVKVRYADAKYGWSIPVFGLAPLIPAPDPAQGGIMPVHGFFGGISIPVNLLVAIIVTTSGKNEYTLKELTYNDLWKYARFPQGIPHDKKLGK